MATPLVSAPPVRRSPSGVALHTRLPTSRPTSPRFSSSPLIPTLSQLGVDLPAPPRYSDDITLAITTAAVAAIAPNFAQYNHTHSYTGGLESFMDTTFHPTYITSSAPPPVRPYGQPCNNTTTYSTPMFDNQAVFYQPEEMQLQDLLVSHSAPFLNSMFQNYPVPYDIPQYPAPSVAQVNSSVGSCHTPFDQRTMLQPIDTSPVTQDAALQISPFTTSSNASFAETETSEQKKESRVGKSKSVVSKRKPRATPSAANWKVRRSKARFAETMPEGMFQVMQFSVPSKVKDSRAQETTKRNRELGACPHHQKNKKSCDPKWFPYVRCVTSKLPTFGPKPEQIQLFRHRPNVGHPLESLREEPYYLQDIERGHYGRDGGVQVILSQGLEQKLKIIVSRFQLRPEDKTKNSFIQNGQRREVDLPPYCVTSLQDTRRKLYSYIQESQLRYLEIVVERSSGLTKKILQRAVRHVAETQSTLVQAALQLISLNRMIEWSWHITGPQTLGIPTIFSATGGFTPITPMMDVQMDQIVIQDFLIPLSKRLLSSLQSKMYERNCNDHFDIFLAVYILATNVEFLLRHSRVNAIRHAAPRRYNSIPLAKAYIEGHNVIMSHYHYFARGSALAVKSKGRKRVDGSGLSEEQIGFVKEVQKGMKEQRQHTRSLREGKRYETEMYWSHHMFEEEWMPESVEVRDEVALC